MRARQSDGWRRMCSITLCGLALMFPTESAMARGKLAVMIVIDQMRGDEMMAFETGWSSGWKKLLEEGEVHTQVLHGHGLTETASGHATLGTATLPERHGVLDKSLFDRQLGRLLGLCDFVAHPGESWAPHCDAGALKVATLGERLKMQSPNSRVVAVASKARSANLLAGQNVDQVLWSNTRTLELSAAAPDAPGRLIALDSKAQANLWVGIEGRAYARSHTPLWAERIAQQHNSCGRWDLPPLTGVWGQRPANPPAWVSGKCGFGKHFPHVFGVDAPEDSASDHGRWDVGWSCSPDSDRWTLDLALESLEGMALGARDTTDLLLISLSATDYVGHAFGFESQERAAILQAVDAALGRFFDGLYAYRDHLPNSQHFDLEVVVTADHGVNPRLDTARAHGFDALALPPEVGEQAMTTALAPWGSCAPNYILRPPFVWLLEPDSQRRKVMAKSVAEALQQVPGVRQTWTKDALAVASSEHARLMRASWEPLRGGDVIMTFERFAKPVQDVSDVCGAWHGGPYRHERHVPWVYLGEGHRPHFDHEPKTVLDALGGFIRFLGLEVEAF